jgi:NTE family protein
MVTENFSVRQTLRNLGSPQHDEQFEKICEELQKIKLNKKFSDVSDIEGNGYVDLVMEGGVMLGIALAGYTYALEKAGLRFFSVGGTSAGSINAILLASWNGEELTPGEWVFKKIFTTNFAQFVDAEGKLKEHLLNSLKQNPKAPDLKESKSQTHKTLNWAKRIISSYDSKYSFGDFFRRLLFGLISFILGVLNLHPLKVPADYALPIVTTGGMNPGEAFLHWLNVCLKEAGVQSTSELMENRQKYLKSKKLNQEIPFTVENLKIIAADVSTSSKIEFPAMADLYWGEDWSKVNPSAFVRASMSVPYFFKPVYLPSEPLKLNPNSNLWEEKVGYTGQLPERSTFVDGGLISNFPIVCFHRDTLKLKKLFHSGDDLESLLKNNSPRKPTFGVKLGIDRSTPNYWKENTYKHNNYKYNYLETDNPLSFLTAMVNTAGGIFDFDFLHKNPDYRNLVAYIPADESQAFNFGMSDLDKYSLFIQGMQTALKFLQGFDWEEYKKLRKSQLEAIFTNTCNNH